MAVDLDANALGQNEEQNKHMADILKLKTVSVFGV